MYFQNLSHLAAYNHGLEYLAATILRHLLFLSGFLGFPLSFKESVVVSTLLSANLFAYLAEFYLII